jgi:thioredoxin reductase (NADPH)
MLFLDCLVIGGGPAGLTAAIYLSRFLLSTAVVDDGGGRARRIPRTRNHAGFPGGISGAELVERMAMQATENGAELLSGRIRSLDRIDGGFEARLAHKRLRARTILIATGITDRRPDALTQAKHDEALASGLIRYCPICDGYEMVDRRIAVLGTGDHGAREASFLRSFTKDVTLIAPDGPHSLTDACRAELLGLAVTVTDGPVTDFVITSTGLSIHTPSGVPVFHAAYPALGAEIHSDLAVAVGADARATGCLTIDDHARTNVPGLYAAGDVVLGLDQISGAMGQAALAATTIRNDLSAVSRRLR